MHVPLFFKTFDLLVRWYQHARSLKKLDRYTVGEQTFSELLAALVFVTRAEYEPPERKRAPLEAASARIDTAKVLVRLVRTLELITEKEYIVIEVELIEIGKSIGGWIRSLERNRQP